MAYEDKTTAEIIADSTWDDVRLTTFRATLPTIVQFHLLRHRAFSFSFASMRAIPLKRQIELVEESPFFPQEWPKNQSGMSASQNIKADNVPGANNQWKVALEDAVSHAWLLGSYGVHKEIASRLLLPFSWTTCIISTTMPGLENFFLQRDHEDAQPEIAILARAMRKALEESTPEEAWVHIPFHTDKGSEGAGTFSPEPAFIRAVARCARVSYGRELEEKPYEEDVKLVERLIRSGHWSPFEQVSAANTTGDLSLAGNFSPPWAQLRHNWRRFLPSIAAKIDNNG